VWGRTPALRGLLPTLALLLAVLVVLASTACDGAEQATPDRLADGSRAHDAPVTLEGVTVPAILTSGRLGRVGARMPEAVSSCVEDEWSGRDVSGWVWRAGARSESVTLLEVSGKAVLACDGSGSRGPGGRRWCGAAFGALTSEGLRDPRLDMLCASDDGEHLAFAWVVPLPRTRYLVVRQPAYAEVYAVAASLPIRVATSSAVDLERSAATFDLSEHDDSGTLLRRYELEAFVAG
jgi:hypothetical protein